HVLHQVGRVGILQPPLASEAVDDRPIKLYEFLPSNVIGPCAKLHKQAGSRQRGFVHSHRRTRKNRGLSISRSPQFPPLMVLMISIRFRLDDGHSLFSYFWAIF